VLVVPIPNANEGTLPQGVPGVERAAEDLVGGGQKGDGAREEPLEGPDLLADERCSRAVLDYLATTDVGRLVPTPVEEDAQRRQSGNSESRENERRRGGQRLRGWVPRLRNPCSSPRPPLWHLRKRSENVLPFFCYFFGAPSFFLDRPRRMAKESLQRATIALTAAGKRSKMYTAIV
jgi:hypothetical protein